MQTCLLFGGSGFIGLSICRRLMKEYNLIVYANSPYLPENLKEKIHVINGNFVTEKNFEILLEKVDIVFHLISTITPQDATEFLEEGITENINPTIRLLEVLKSHPEILLVFFSSGGVVYGNCGRVPIPEATPLHPINAYGVQKAAIEMYIQMYGYLYGMRYLILRVSNPYGMEQDPQKKQGIIPIFTRHILAGQTISVWGDGLNIRDYIFIDDLTSAVEILLHSGINGKIYNIGSGCGHTIMQVIKLICMYTGKTVDDVIYLPPRLCDVRENVLDTSLIWKEAGWRAATSLTDGIKRILG